MGLAFYHGDTVTGEPTFSLAECFAALRRGEDITFADAGVERFLDVATLLQFDGRCSLPTEQHIL